MTFDYANARATAARLIANFGQTATLVRRANPAGEPWNPRAVASDGELTIRAVDLGIKDRLRPGALTRTLARVIYVDANGARPEQGDRIVLGGVAHQIAAVMPLSPAGVDVMFEVQVEV
jgi:hypothetical protein